MVLEMNKNLFSFSDILLESRACETYCQTYFTFCENYFQIYLPHLGKQACLTPASAGTFKSIWDQFQDKLLIHKLNIFVR